MSWPHITPTVWLHKTQFKDLCSMFSLWWTTRIETIQKVRMRMMMRMMFYLHNVEAEMSLGRMRKRNLSAPVLLLLPNHQPPSPSALRCFPLPALPHSTLPACLSHDLTPHPPRLSPRGQSGSGWGVLLLTLREIKLSWSGAAPQSEIRQTFKPEVECSFSKSNL